MKHRLSVFGMAIVIIGLLVELVAVAAMASYPLRRALPFKSPIRLQSLGCMIFTLGIVVLALGQSLG